MPSYSPTILHTHSTSYSQDYFYHHKLLSHLFIHRVKVSKDKINASVSTHLTTISPCTHLSSPFTKLTHQPLPPPPIHPAPHLVSIVQITGSNHAQTPLFHPLTTLQQPFSCAPTSATSPADKYIKLKPTLHYHFFIISITVLSLLLFFYFIISNVILFYLFFHSFFSHYFYSISFSAVFSVQL